MFVADCTAALALTLAACEWESRLWVMRGTDLAHWAESGVETAADLAGLLQAEHEREERKSAMCEGGFDTPADYAAWEAETLEWIEQQAANDDAAAAEERAWKVWDYEVDARGRVRFAA